MLGFFMLSKNVSECASMKYHKFFRMLSNAYQECYQGCNKNECQRMRFNVAHHPPGLNFFSQDLNLAHSMLLLSC